MIAYGRIDEISVDNLLFVDPLGRVWYKGKNRKDTQWSQTLYE